MPRRRTDSLLDEQARSLKKSERKNKIYRLARVLKKQGYEVSVLDRAIDLPYSTIEEVPKGPRYYVRQLIRLGFNHQLKLF